MLRIRSPLVVLAAAAIASSCNFDLRPLIPSVQDCSAYVTSVQLLPIMDTIEVGRGLLLEDTMFVSQRPSNVICTYSKSWTSSDWSVLSLATDAYEKRMAVGQKAETATVTYSVGTKTASATLTVIAPRSPYVRVAAGFSHVCVQSGTGDTFCWDPSMDPGPLLVPTNDALASVDLGETTTCAISTSKAVVCWPTLGPGPSVVRRPTPVPALADIVALDVGGRAHSCAVTAGGSTYCWGSNAFGQLGNPSASTQIWDSVPVAVSGGLKFGTVALGFYHSCGLAADGSVWCWGDNSTHQLGNDGTTGTCPFGPCQMTPIRAASGSTYYALTAGGYHTCALTGQGDAYCWGQNTYGELGTGDTVSSATPRRVGGNLSFVAISAGGMHTCALTVAGAAYCWGVDVTGQLGDNGLASGPCGSKNSTMPCALMPVQVTGGLTFSAINSADYMTCGIASDGAWCWGSGWGAGGKISSWVPVRLPGQP